jgi:1-acyl-sn-glycerol-3-phosphate acyltransferase
LAQIPKSGRFLLVCNHLHNVDPAFILRSFPKKGIAFIAKREAGKMFLIGPILKQLRCQLVNRENDREALKTILRCISLLKEDKASVAIFPEGRINPYRQLAHFRPGVFKIAQKAQVPIVVCTMQNTHKVIGQLLKLKGSRVDLHLLDVVAAEELVVAAESDVAPTEENVASDEAN